MIEPNEIRKTNKEFAKNKIQFELSLMLSHTGLSMSRMHVRRLIVIALEYMDLNEFERENYYKRAEKRVMEFWNKSISLFPIPQEEVKYSYAVEEVSDLFFAGEDYYYINSKRVITDNTK